MESFERTRQVSVREQQGQGGGTGWALVAVKPDPEMDVGRLSKQVVTNVACPGYVSCRCLLQDPGPVSAKCVGGCSRLAFLVALFSRCLPSTRVNGTPSGQETYVTVYVYSRRLGVQRETAGRELRFRAGRASPFGLVSRWNGSALHASQVEFVRWLQVPICGWDDT